MLELEMWDTECVDSFWKPVLTTNMPSMCPQMQLALLVVEVAVCVGGGSLFASQPPRPK